MTDARSSAYLVDEDLNEIVSILRGADFVSMEQRLFAADEIERLRAALESLIEDPPATLDEPDADWVIINKMRTIARQALKNGKG
jgi:hypothetical protein